MATALLLCGATACVFTEPINVPPTLQIDAPDKVWRAEPAEFRALTSDDQPEPVPVTWTLTKGGCPQDPAAPRDASVVAVGEGERFIAPATATREPFCVAAVATDRHGATRAAAFDAKPANHPPVARIDVIAPTGLTVPLYSEIRLSGAASSDLEGDPLTHRWELVRQPPGSTARLEPCAADPSTSDRCLQAATAGDYQVALVVSDGFDDSPAAIRDVKVLDDQPPCLSSTNPSFEAPVLVREPNQDMTFDVIAVADDGDPLPGGFPTFTWWLGRDQDPLTRLNNDLPQQTFVGGMFRSGDVVRVRVEVADRNRQALSQILFSCGDDDFCSSRPGSGCFQRVTWKVHIR